MKLNFAYQDAENGRIYNRDSQPVETYNDTSEIIYHENRRQVPGECKKCHIIVTLTGQMGSQVEQGLSITSSDVIGKLDKICTVFVLVIFYNCTDVEARTSQQTIDHLNSTLVTTRVTLVSIIIILVIIIAVLSCCLIHAHLKQRKWKENKKFALKEVKGNTINENMTDMNTCPEIQRYGYRNACKSPQLRVTQSIQLYG